MVTSTMKKNEAGPTAVTVACYFRYGGQGKPLWVACHGKNQIVWFNSFCSS